LGVCKYITHIRYSSNYVFLDITTVEGIYTPIIAGFYE